MLPLSDWNCRAARQLFDADFDDEWRDKAADSAAHRLQSRRLRSHLDKCAACRSQWQAQVGEWQEVRAALAGHPTIAASPDFNRRVLERLQQARQRSRRQQMQTFLARPLPRLLGATLFGLLFALLCAAPLPFSIAAQTPSQTPLLPVASASGDALSLEYALQQRNVLAEQLQAPPYGEPIGKPIVEEDLRWQTNSQSKPPSGAAGPSASRFLPRSGSLC